MSEIHWVKLSTQMFDDEKIRVIETMPSGGDICLIWVKLIVLAGRTNDNGLVYLTKNLPYTPDMLARIFSKPVEMIRIAIEAFVNLDMIEVSKENIIVLLNWERHQNIEGMDKVRRLTKDRVKRFREKQKLLVCNATGNATVTPGNAIDLDVELEGDKEKKEKKAERAPLVLLTDSELDKLEKEYGVKNTQAAIKKLSAFKLSKGKRYKSDYGAILSWAMRSVLEKGAVPEPTTGSRREVEVVDDKYYQETGKIRTKRETR